MMDSETGAGRQIVINDVDTLAQCSDLLRDAVLPYRSIEYRSSTNTLCCEVWWPDWNRGYFEPLLGPLCWKVTPRWKARLVFAFIEHVTFERLASRVRSEEYTLGAIKWDGFKELLVETYDGLTVRACTKVLNGTLELDNSAPGKNIRRVAIRCRR